MNPDDVKVEMPEGMENGASQRRFCLSHFTVLANADLWEPPWGTYSVGTHWLPATQVTPLSLVPNTLAEIISES